MRVLSLIVLAITVLAVSCSKENTEFESNLPQKLSATIDGQKWESQQTTVTIKEGVVNITGVGLNESKTLTFILNSFREGAFALNQNSPNLAAYVKSSFDTESYTSTNTGTNGVMADGIMEIEEINFEESWFSGNFEMTLYNRTDSIPVVVEDGQFARMPFNMFTNNFEALIDGEEFKGTRIEVNNDGEKLSLKGTSSNGKQSVEIIIPENLSFGDYIVGGTEEIEAIYYPDGNEMLNGERGNLRILKHDPTTQVIEGNFNFDTDLNPQTAQHIGNGSFYIKY